MTASKRLGALLGLAWLLGSALSHAQPSAAQKETARGLMAEARERRDQGDLEGALARFGAADALMNVPTTGFEVAATQAQLGRLVEARETLRRVLAIPQSPDDPEPFNEARSKARTLDQQLLARIGTLRFEPSGLGPDETLELTVDGEAVPKAVQGLPLRVNPGHHVVVARARGREIRQDVSAAESKATSVPLVFLGDAPQGAPPVDAPVRAPAAPAQAAAPDEQRPVPTLAYVGGGVAAIGIIAGSITGISAISHKNAAKKGCVDGSCPRSTWSDLDSAHSMATASTVGFVVGAIGLVVGAGALLLGEEPAPTQKAFVVAPDVGAHGARLTLAGSF